jgi:hypothetical protein
MTILREVEVGGFHRRDALTAFIDGSSNSLRIYPGWEIVAIDPSRG